MVSDAGGGVSYDPGERRETALLHALRAEIAARGYFNVAEYMERCLWDEAHGYYATREPIGAAGDFTTAPEISQIFGELIGLWMTAVWRQMGAPPAVSIVEYGPGRGTLMRDAMRAARLVPEFMTAARIVFIERSARFEAAQRRTVAGLPVPVEWTPYHWEIPAPAIVVANEFLDAQPVHQWVKTEAGWRERGVGLDGAGKLAFTVLESPAASKDLDAIFPEAMPGAIAEENDMSAHLSVIDVAAAAESGACAALFIDYGYVEPRLGETIEAVRGHKLEHPLSSPGEADLSAHVDFATLASLARREGLAVDGPVTQAEFLGSLGIMERASRLMAANPSKAGEIEAAVARIMAPNGMGTRFKAIGLRSPRIPPLPGFPG